VGVRVSVRGQAYAYPLLPTLPQASARTAAVLEARPGAWSSCRIGCSAPG